MLFHKVSSNEFIFIPEYLKILDSLLSSVIGSEIVWIIPWIPAFCFYVEHSSGS